MTHNRMILFSGLSSTLLPLCLHCLLAPSSFLSSLSCSLYCAQVGACSTNNTKTTCRWHLMSTHNTRYQYLGLSTPKTNLDFLYSPRPQLLVLLLYVRLPVLQVLHETKHILGILSHLKLKFNGFVSPGHNIPCTHAFAFGQCLNTCQFGFCVATKWKIRESRCRTIAAS